MSAHAVAQLKDLPRIPASGPDEPAWTPIRHPLGIGAFGVNAWHGERTGDVIIDAHDEVPSPGDAANGHEELYLVVEGRARFVVDGEEIDGPAGTVLALPPHVRREAHAASDGTLIVAIGAPRGEAFTPSAWERRAIEKAGLL
jgi:hypothetical protein